MKILDKVWITEGNSVYPGIIINEIAEVYVVLKFDKAIWRRIVCYPKDLSLREDDFSEFMFKVRESLCKVKLNFALP